MPTRYIDRDNGVIVADYARMQREGQETIDTTDAEFVLYKRGNTWADIRAHKKQMIVGDDDLNDALEIHEREVAHDGTLEADYTMPVTLYQDFLTYFQQIRAVKSVDDGGTMATVQDAYDALDALEATKPTL